MTKASREGRRLRLEVDGIDDPFLVDPISAIRGRYLTDLFILGALGQVSAPQLEAIFIESLGPANYARATGFLVDQYEDHGDDIGEWRMTFGPRGRIDGAAARERLPEKLEDGSDGYRGLRYLATRPDHELEGADALRQEEVEALALVAFYWQTVAGMEAVEAFLAEGEGTAGSLKAMSLLQFRLGLSPSRTSRRSESESPTQQAGTPVTTTRPGGAKLAALPVMPRTHESRPTQAAKGVSFFRRSR